MRRTQPVTRKQDSCRDNYKLVSFKIDFNWMDNMFQKGSIAGTTNFALRSLMK